MMFRFFAEAEDRIGLGPEGVEADDGLPGLLQSGQLGGRVVVVGHEAMDGQVGLENGRLETGQLLCLQLQHNRNFVNMD
jgi:hypothetical protein